MSENVGIFGLFSVWQPKPTAQTRQSDFLLPFVTFCDFFHHKKTCRLQKVQKSVQKRCSFQGLMRE